MRLILEGTTVLAKFRYILTITITTLPRTHLNATEFIENRVSLPEYLKIIFFRDTLQMYICLKVCEGLYQIPKFQKKSDLVVEELIFKFIIRKYNKFLIKKAFGVAFKHYYEVKKILKYLLILGCISIGL